METVCKGMPTYSYFLIYPHMIQSHKAAKPFRNQGFRLLNKVEALLPPGGKSTFTYSPQTTAVSTPLTGPSTAL
jgi:hypothetical protein